MDIENSTRSPYRTINAFFDLFPDTSDWNGTIFYFSFFFFIFWACGYSYLIDIKVAERINRHLFVIAHFFLALGSAFQLTFYHTLMVFPMMEVNLWTLSLVAFTLFLAVVGLHMILPYRKVCRKAKLRLSPKLTPGFPTLIILFAISVAIGILFNRFFNLQIEYGWNMKFVCFLLIILYWYLTMEAMNLLGIVVKANRFEITDEEGRRVGDYMLKNDEWQAFVDLVQPAPIIPETRYSMFQL